MRPPLAPAKKIIFVKFGTFSHTNGAVKNLLENRFPECDIVVLDIPTVIKKLSFQFLQLNLHGFWDYGKDIVLGRKNLKVYRWRTEFLCQTVKKLMQETFPNQDEILFTYQTQSFFDASIPGLPHFLYTDHTLLANQEYPDINLDDYGFSSGWRALEKSFYHNSSCVFTMSKNVSRSLMRDYDLPAEQIECVGVGANAYEGMNLSDFPERSVESYQGKTILFVGVLWELKGGPELVAAFKIVRKRHPDAQLIIVGSTPDIKEENVTVVGRIPLAEVGNYFNSSTVFCMPSKGDAFGIVFLEAFFNRIPVIALEIGAAPDIIQQGETGFMIPPGDIQGLAEKLSELIEDPDKCKQFGDRGFSANYPQFTWDHVGSLMKSRIKQDIT